MSSSVAYISEVPEGGGEKEDFHSSVRHRVSAVKPNIRDSIRNMESRCASPIRENKENQPSFTSAGVLFASQYIGVIRSAYFSLCVPLPHMEKKGTVTKKRKKKRKK